MKRFAPLALVVLALAAVPAAFADDGNTPAPTAPAAAAPTVQQAGVRTRVEILRLRLRIVQLRFALHCGDKGNAPSDKCVAFAQKVEQRLQKLDGNVQKRIDEIQQNCTSTSTDPKCKNADKKVALLQKMDTHLQAVILKIQDWLNGKATTAPSGDSALDQAANDLGQLAGSSG
jgi:hypothetical protein